VPSQVEFLSPRPSGGFLGGWRQPRAGWVVLQLFDRAGRRVGPQRRLNETRMADSAVEVAFAHRADGGFVVVFTGANDSSSFEGRIFARRFDAAGEPIGGEIPLSSAPAASRFSTPRVVTLRGGGFVAAWKRNIFGEQGIGVRVVDASGAPVGPEAVPVSGFSGHALAGLDVDPASDRVVVLVQFDDEVCADGICVHLYAVLFGSDGAQIGPIADVATPATLPFMVECGHLAAIAPHRWAVSWLGTDLAGGRYRVFVRRLADVTP
jgi:hypothetical protein